MRRLLRYSLSKRFFSSCWHLLHLHVFESLISTSTHSPQSIHWIYLVFLTLRLFSKLFTMYWPVSLHITDEFQFSKTIENKGFFEYFGKSRLTFSVPQALIYYIHKKKNGICTKKANKINAFQRFLKAIFPCWSQIILLQI